MPRSRYRFLGNQAPHFFAMTISITTRSSEAMWTGLGTGADPARAALGLIKVEPGWRGP